MVLSRRERRAPGGGSAGDAGAAWAVARGGVGGRGGGGTGVQVEVRSSAMQAKNGDAERGMVGWYR